ncbi:hypothetical protein PYW08_010413 [Mythimna loreyi]|uniref:Uncharacterized protein n=1 Tax=Mythimna loreyi TaxID=667449 RepID=A0ACC2Q4Q5_9NEOP|nr:hypothetical protein PYW08_010413 [Mythimna loreyi]
MELNSNYGNHRNVEHADPVSMPPPQPPPDGPKYVVHSEKDTYDYVAHRCTEKPTNALESTGHLIKGCLGGGILGIHEAYMKCGLWTSLFVTIIFGFYIAYCVHILVSSAQLLYKRLHIPQMSYPDVAEAALEVGPFPRLRRYSKWFRYAVDVIICIDLFGACCVYQIIIAKTIQQLVETEEGTEDLDYLRLYILTLLVPILLLCMITTLKYLAPFTLIADVFIVTCVVATIVYSQRTAPKISEVPAWKDVIGFFEFCGIVVFSMEGIGVSLPIENNMRNPKQFPIVLVGGMTVVVSFLILVGFFGYWGFGEKSISPVTLNFPSEIFPTILKVLMAIMIFVTFALNFWAPFNLVWYYVSKKHDPKKYWIWERVYRATFIVIITGLAIAFPNIGNLMGLLGAFCLSSIGFIFPAMIELLVVWENPGLGKYKWRLWKNVIVLIIGVLLFVAGTYSNAKGLIASFYLHLGKSEESEEKTNKTENTANDDDEDESASIQVVHRDVVAEKHDKSLEKEVDINIEEENSTEVLNVADDMNTTKAQAKYDAFFEDLVVDSGELPLEDRNENVEEVSISDTVPSEENNEYNNGQNKIATAIEDITVPYKHDEKSQEENEEDEHNWRSAENSHSEENKYADEAANEESVEDEKDYSTEEYMDKKIDIEVKGRMDTRHPERRQQFDTRQMNARRYGPPESHGMLDSAPMRNYNEMVVPRYRPVLTRNGIVYTPSLYPIHPGTSLLDRLSGRPNWLPNRPYMHPESDAFKQLHSRVIEAHPYEDSKVIDDYNDYGSNTNTYTYTPARKVTTQAPSQQIASPNKFDVFQKLVEASSHPKSQRRNFNDFSDNYHPQRQYENFGSYNIRRIRRYAWDEPPFQDI